MPAAIKKEKVIELVLSFIEREGRNPIYKEFKPDIVGCSTRPIYRIWGSMEEMFEDLGLIPNRVFSYTKEQVKNAVSIQADLLKRMPTLKEIVKLCEEDINFPSQGAIYKHYPSLNSLAQDIGTPINVESYTKKDIIFIIKNKCDELGRMITMGEIKKLSKMNISFPGQNTIYKHYSSHEDLAVGVGYEVDYVFYSKYSVKTAIAIAAALLGRMMTSKELFDMSRKDPNFPSSKSIYKYYNSFEELAIDIGFTPNNISWTKEKVKEVAIKVLVNYVEMPTARELTKLSEDIKYFPSVSAIYTNGWTLKTLAKEIGIPYNPNDGTSIWEKEVVSFVKSITNENIEENDRTALENGKEIDIYIPDLDIGIECNGDYWHSKEYKDKNYHINKTNRAKEFGITLIHIFESEWENNREEIEQYLRSIINKTTAQIYRGKNKLEIDNMKPMKYINIQVVEVKEPQLKTFGKHQCWDCGTTIYEVIE